MQDFNIQIKENCVIINVNPKVYPLEAVYSAAYVFLDRAYIVLDGDPEKEIIVKMKMKDGGAFENLGNEFNNELLNYADYFVRARETKKLREMFLQRAIITNDPGMVDPETEGDIDFDDAENLDDDYLDDPEGIAIPWEEKYDDKAKNDQDKAKEKDQEKNENKLEQ